MTRMARMKSNFSTEDPEPLRAKNTAQPSRNQSSQARINHTDTEGREQRSRNQNALTAEYAEYAEGQRASVWFSAYFARSAVQSSSSQPVSGLGDGSAVGR